MRRAVSTRRWIATAQARSEHAKDVKCPRFHNITQRDNSQHQPQLESLYHVRTRDLEQVLFLEFLKHTRLDLDKLVGEEKRNESI